MKKYIILLCLLLSASMAWAQEIRQMQGIVIDKVSGSPINGARISRGDDILCVTNANGEFQCNISVYAKNVTISAPDYLSENREVDGAYMVVKLSVNQQIIEKRRAEEAEKARLKAEEEARIRAEEEKEKARIKAEEEARIRAQEEEKARVKAEEEARIRAQEEEKARIKAEEEARIRAEEEEKARIKAEEEARIRAEEAEKIRLRAEEESRIAAEKRAKERQAAKDERLANHEQYNRQYRNKGIINSFELSYAMQIVGGGSVVYTNLGYRDYFNLHPIAFDYLFGYRVSNYFAVNLGIGLMCNMVNLTACGDTFSESLYGDVKYSPLNIPIYGNVRLYLSRGKVQPMLTTSLGAYIMTGNILFEIGGGLNFRLSKRANMYITISAKSTPWPVFTRGEYYGYEAPIAPCFKIGFTM